MSDHTLARQYRDFSAELSTARVYVPAMTALTIAGLLPQFAAYEITLDNITLGVAAQSVITLDRTVISAGLPASAFAQREMKWLVHYHSATLGTKFTMEIPTADPAGRLIPGTDRMDLTEANALAWKTSFEVIAVSPDDDTDQCVVDFVELVGRNL